MYVLDRITFCNWTVLISWAKDAREEQTINDTQCYYHR